MQSECKKQPVEPDMRDVLVWTISENDGSVSCIVDGHELSVEVERSWLGILRMLQ